MMLEKHDQRKGTREKPQHEDIPGTVKQKREPESAKEKDEPQTLKEKEKPQTPKEKWLATIDSDDEANQKEQWVQNQTRKRSLKHRIDMKMRRGKQLDMTEVAGVLEAIPVGFHIASPRPVVIGDPGW